MPHRRRIVLLQLPIPQPGLDAARGNVPLAAGYVKMYARARGLESTYDIEILPAPVANRAGDQALVQAILARDPWMVGFTCYLWNVERSLWVAEQIKRLRPGVFVLLGGPEITADNAWVLDSPMVDFAALGEGEQTFADLLAALSGAALPLATIPGLWINRAALATAAHHGGGPAAGAAAGVAPLAVRPPFRTPLPRLDDISSPYLQGILDAADERMLLLETIRGCIFKCKFCFYPKSYDDLYFLSDELIVANLQHARARGAREVILLDPTLNQRKDFPGFLRVLARCNPEQQFTYFGELRAEGIDPTIANLLRDANFTEVEIGLQSTDPQAQKLMDRRNNMRGFERGVQALLDAGIRVKIDLIVGLPGDTPETVRRGMAWVKESGLYSDVQVFNLAILPGTAFREEAAALGLTHQARPPYYVLRTPTMALDDMYELMAEAEEIFDLEFDAVPEPRLPAALGLLGTPGAAGGSTATPAPGVAVGSWTDGWRIDFDAANSAPMPPSSGRAQAFTLWFRGRDLEARVAECVRSVEQVLADNPFTTLQVVLEPSGASAPPGPAAVSRLLEACYARPTYLDRFYAVMPGVPKGAKRVVLLLPAAARASLTDEWVETLTDQAAILWHGPGADTLDRNEQEFALP